ncbi:hypothetical protein [Agrococcus terreus]|uniref:Uncharacterized protein n=1 Tax=Agrococcus terreus TaxID=574649 RepID=A0ABQ2KI99_9MICO|nr:hypothetical protein [Agrococcus terreus]GGN84304.1 hypothetical protein GCM10010968_15900 [Agrococcus terreus]
MTQLMVASSTAILGTAHSGAADLVWATPGEDLWVASRHADGTTTFHGFIEHAFGEYVAVDGEGASLGRHATLEAAQAAFTAGRA